MTRTQFLDARLSLSLGLVLLTQFAAAQATTPKEYSLKLDLDTLLASPEVWATTPEKLAELYPKGTFNSNPYFKWLSEAKESARFAKQPFSNITVGITTFGGQVPVDEAVAEFKGGKLNAITISLYNRGDSGKMSKEDFEARFKISGAALGQRLGVRPAPRNPTTQTAIKTSGWLWTSPSTLALLEYNTDALVKPAAAEFMRLKLSPAAEKDALLNVAAIGRGSNALKRGELLKFVKKESDGDTYITGIPMVDQGAKGYCTVASCQRVFGYFHIPCDEHELAAICGSSASGGTSNLAFAEALKKVDNRFKTRFKPLLQKYSGKASADPNARPDKFLKMIAEHVDKGVPLLWGLELGLFPEEPPLKIQGTGGHTRIIIGYNQAKDELLYTDSWGQGHELKRMKLENAISATHWVFLLEPREFY